MPEDLRPMGLYINPRTYPPEGTLGSVVLTEIERKSGDDKITSIILTPIDVIHAIDRMRAIQMDAERKGHHFSPESRESVAIRESAAGCVRRLLEMDLPEKNVLHAQDAVAGYLENLLQRQRAGEFSPR